jgi:hypothetical protein
MSNTFYLERIVVKNRGFSVPAIHKIFPYYEYNFGVTSWLFSIDAKRKKCQRIKKIIPKNIHLQPPSRK